jgi:hypothetical protein
MIPWIKPFIALPAIVAHKVGCEDPHALDGPPHPLARRRRPDAAAARADWQFIGLETVVYVGQPKGRCRPQADVRLAAR